MAETSSLGASTVALITGASSGIGAATAVRLAEKGARVICVGRDRKRLDGVVGQFGGRGHALELEITDPAAASLLERLPEELRAIDVLINNAGHDTGGRQRSIRATWRTGPRSSRPT